MTLTELRTAIAQQRAVRMSGYRGYGVEVDCDELERLIAVTEAAMQWAFRYDDRGDDGIRWMRIGYPEEVALRKAVSGLLPVHEGVATPDGSA